MPRFIKNNQFTQLRKAMQDGDERAKAILLAQIDDDGSQEDFDRLLSEYFAPVQEEAEQPSSTTPDMEINGMSGEISTGNKLLDRFLKDNNVSKDDEDYQEYVDSFFEMFPEEKSKQEAEVKEVSTPITSSSEEELFIPEPEEPDKKITFDDLINDELEAIKAYDTFVQNFVIECEDPDIVLTVKAIINKIREDEFRHIEELKALKCKMCDKEVLTTEEIE